MFAAAFVLLFIGFTTEASANCIITGQVYDYPSNQPVVGQGITVYVGSSVYSTDSTTTSGQYGVTVPNNSSGYVALDTSPSYDYLSNFNGYTYYYLYTCGTSQVFSNISWYRGSAPQAISGNVRHAFTNAPIANRTVRIYNNLIWGAYGSNASYYTATTDANGNFTSSITCLEDHDIVVLPAGNETGVTTYYQSGDYYVNVQCGYTYRNSLDFLVY
ncbi:MAG TPA: hypothetical protein VGB02_12730 [Pyrinomonadaceae bacterium]